MTNELKNVPELRFPEFDGEWEEKRFENIFQEISNKTSDLAKYPLYSLTVEHGITPKSDRYKRDFLVKKNDNFKIVELYNIVYNPMNITLGAIDLSVYNYNIAVSGYYHVLKIIDNSNVNFLVNFLKTNQMINHYKKIATGTLIEKQRVHFSEFKNIVKKFPNINEQQKIGEFFSKLDQQIELEEQKLAKLEEQKKGYMQKIFSQELRFKDKNGNEYPEWEVIKLKDILSERKEYASKIGNYPHATLSTSGISLKSDRYNRDFLVKDKNKKYKVTIMNDICYNPANLKFGVITRNHIGSVIFSPIYITFEVNNAHSPLFIELLVTRNDFINRVRKYEEGTVYERMAVKPEDFLNYETKIPCLEEQEKIGDFFSKLDEVINKQSQKIDELKLRKQGFLQKMFV